MNRSRAMSRFAISFEPGEFALAVAVYGGLVLVVVASPMILSGWASMFVNCAAVFLGLKHCVWTGSPGSTKSATIADRVAFYLLWPGMDVEAFLNVRMIGHRKPFVGEGLHAVLKIVVAATGLWILLPLLNGYPAALVGMAGMLGAILLVHCGLFHGVALAWRSHGRNVLPIMNAPLLADSLVDFWSRRWNLAFRDAAALLVFRPTARRWGVAAGTFATFLASGLIHDAAISLPARGGYGLPTLYFLLQFVGLIAERRFLRGGGRGKAIVARIVAAIVIVAPIPLLFHPPFAENVIVPLFNACGVLDTPGANLP